MSLYLTSVLINICLISFLALSAYLILIVGEVSFGQQAFFGVGAYLAGMGTTLFELNFVLALIIGILCGSVLAGLLAKLTLKLRGFFFSISTLAFAEIFRFGMLQVQYKKFVNGEELGPGGAEGFENIRWIFDQGLTPQTFLIFVAVMLFGIIALMIWAERTSYFKSARMVGEDPALAQALGLRPDFYRITLISVAGGIAALGGGLFAFQNTYIEPGMFSIMIGVHSLAYAVLGGLGTPIGPLIGAIIDIGLLESIRVISSYRMIVFGGLIAVFLILMPQGVLSPRFVRKIKQRLRRQNV